MVDIKKRTHASKQGHKWTYQNLINFGKDGVGEKRLCPVCYDKTEVPVGEVIHKYKNQWEHLEKTGFEIKGKTVINFFKCTKCGYRKIVKDTYRNGPNRRSIEDIKKLLIIYAQTSWESIIEYCEFISEEMKAESIGRIKGLKDAYDLLDGG